MARPKKQQTGEAGSTGDTGVTGDAGSTQTTGSSGNARHRAQKQQPTLSRRVATMERQIDQQGALLQRIARAVS